MGKKTRYAIISVSDKHHIVEFAKGLLNLSDRWRILSTSGTAKMLREAGVPVIDVSKYTGHPECLDGRVKTLHPKIFGGILAMNTREHLATMRKLGYPLIELVVVNLYPFEQTIAKPNVDEKEAIEQIDIGGPSMLRAAAKNYDRTAVVMDPDDYGRVLDALRKGMTALPLSTRKTLAIKVFRTTSKYDAAVADYWEGRLTSDQTTVLAQKGLA